MRAAEVVLVTRAEPGASALVAALERAGFRAFAHPVIEIRARGPLRTAEELTIDGWSVAIFVSTHAVEHGLPVLSKGPSPYDPPRQWVAVGASTARALAVRGIDAAHPDDETSEGILALPALADVEDRSIVIVAGNEGRDVLANVLRKRGARVAVLRVYDRLPTATSLSPHLAAAVGTVVLSSVDGAKAFARQWTATDGARTVCAVVPSTRVAEAVRTLGFDNVVVSEGASNDAVIAALIGDVRS